LLYSHQKDFAVRQKLAEIFIVQCDFTGKMTQPSSVTNFVAIEDCQNPHLQNMTMCQQKIKTPISETARLVKDAPAKSVPITSTEKITFSCGTCRKNPLNIAILPVKSPFHKNRVSHFVPVFDRPLSCTLIYLKRVMKRKLSKS